MPVMLDRILRFETLKFIQKTNTVLPFKRNWKKTTLAIRTTADLAGSGKKHAIVSEMKRLLVRTRAEDD